MTRYQFPLDPFGFDWLWGTHHYRLHCPHDVSLGYTQVAINHRLAGTDAVAYALRDHIHMLLDAEYPDPYGAGVPESLDGDYALADWLRSAEGASHAHARLTLTGELSLWVESLASGAGRWVAVSIDRDDLDHSDCDDDCLDVCVFN